MSVNEAIRDDLVEHDLDLRRLDGDVRNQIDRRYDELDRQLKELLTRHDPHGAVRKRTREKRLREFQADARKAISAANKDANAILRKTLREVARLESTAVIDSIVESLP